MWVELAEDDEDFQSEFNKVFENSAVKESDEEFTPDSYNNYFNMELTLNRGGDTTEFARVKKILKNANRRPIIVVNDNPILESRMYEVKYHDGYVTSMADNLIDDNLLAQVNQEDKIVVLIESIIDTITDSTQTLQKNAFVITKIGTKREKKYN